MLVIIILNMIYDAFLYTCPREKLHKYCILKWRTVGLNLTTLRSTGKWHVWRHKKRLRRRDATRSKNKLKLHLKFGNLGRSRAVLKFSSWFPFPFLIASLLFRRIFKTCHFPALPTLNTTICTFYVC